LTQKNTSGRLNGYWSYWIYGYFTGFW